MSIRKTCYINSKHFANQEIFLHSDLSAFIQHRTADIGGYSDLFCQEVIFDAIGIQIGFDPRSKNIVPLPAKLR